MLHLIEPAPRYLSSYMEAYDEYAIQHVTSYRFTDPHTCDIFAKFDRYKHACNLPQGRVGATYFWLVNNETDEFLGEITIRHALTPMLERYGGHIGYGVRYSAWKRGFGTQMLALALKKAKEIGLDRVLITCDDDNIGSARVMEKNGFVLCDKVENSIGGQKVLTRRYFKTL